MLRGRRGHEDIYFENIVAPTFSSAANAGISKEDAMATIHIIKRDGTILKGMDALATLYDVVRRLRRGAAGRLRRADASTGALHRWD